MKRRSILLSVLLLLFTGCAAVAEPSPAEQSAVVEEETPPVSPPEPEPGKPPPPEPEEAPLPITRQHDREVEADGQPLVLRFLGTEQGYVAMEVLDGESGASLYKGNLPLWGWAEAGGFPHDRIEGDGYGKPDIRLVDMDFDGHTDLQVNLGMNGTWREAIHYLLRDPETGGFLRDPYNLEELGNPRFDGEAQVVHSMVKASAIWRMEYEHQYRDGVLVLMEDRECSSGSAPDPVVEQILGKIPPVHGLSVTRITRRTLQEETGDMTLADITYLMYDNYTREIFASYDAGSDEGQLLEALFARP